MTEQNLKSESMNCKDQKFFDDHYRLWCRKHPMPGQFDGSHRDYAMLEMPCCGLLGRILYWIDMHIDTELMR